MILKISNIHDLTQGKRTIYAQTVPSVRRFYNAMHLLCNNHKYNQTVSYREAKESPNLMSIYISLL